MPAADQSTTTGELKRGMGGELTGWYLLDNGDGQTEYSDLAHSFQTYLATGGGEPDLCVAVGDTEVYLSIFSLG